MSSSQNCDYCKNDFPLSSSKCIHCSQPSLFPNVKVTILEKPSLEKRYIEAKKKATSKGAIANVSDFETALSSSFAVINRSISELSRLIGSELEGYATYYQLASSSVKTPSGEIWDSRRQAADSIFFPNYQDEIRFAALSLNSSGLSNYGECSWVFREDMIAHRATLFEENTTLYYLKNFIRDAEDLPKGYRALWEDRAKLGVAKLAKSVDTTTKPAEYSNILLHQGATSDEDKFIEVHIYGSITILTIAEVAFSSLPVKSSKKTRKLKKARIAAMKEKLNKYKIKIS